MSKQITRKEAIGELWRRGHLSYLLDSNQKSLYELFHNSTHKIQTWLLARRSGKSYSLLTLALEQCIRHDRSIVKYLCPTKLMADTIIRPLMQQLVVDCPEDLKPEFRVKDYTYFFKNGSEIQLAGSESGHAQKLRGISCNIAIVDEAGDVTDLEDIITSILLPTTLTTKGRVIIAGTPPKSPDHDFIKYIEAAQDKGSLILRTIEDNPRLTDSERDEFIIEMGGKLSESVRRELYCEIIRDTTIVVVPEFDDRAQSEIVREYPLPPHSHTYTAMDLGYRDLTALVFGYYDFRGGRYVIQDELIYNFNERDKNISDLTEQIKNKEAELWTNPYSGEVKPVQKRVSDINHIVTNEIRRLSHGDIGFDNARKDDKEAAISFLRSMISQRKIVINPKCKNLIRHLKNAKWSDRTNKTKFGRDAENGHYDLVDALIYWLRAVDTSHNPYPTGYGYSMGQDLHVINAEKFRGDDQAQVFRTVFNRKLRR